MLTILWLLIQDAFHAVRRRVYHLFGRVAPEDQDDMIDIADAMTAVGLIATLVSQHGGTKERIESLSDKLSEALGVAREKDEP